MDDIGPINFKIQFTSPIVITSDDDFDEVADYWNWGGDGRKSTPYIISGGYIYAVGSTTLKLINISNTQKYFIIEDCDLFGGGVAIYLENVIHGVIRDNWVEKSVKGVDLRNCYDINITSNTFREGSSALYFDNASEVIINNNWINATSTGFNLRNCNDLTISSNTIQFSQSGIFLYDNINNSVIESNIVNHTVTNGIILNEDCYYNNVTNNIIVDVEYYGIRIRYSDNNEIIGNTVDDIWGSNAYGLFLNFASNNKINNNSISNGNKYGMGLIFPCLNNEIAFNNITDTGELGIYVINSYVSNNSFHKNRIERHNYGIVDEGSGGNTYSDNFIYKGYSAGAYILSNATLTNNHFVAGGRGVQINGENNILEGNHLEDGNNVGIYGYPGSNNNTIRSNILENISSTAIYLSSSSNYTIVDNILNGNEGDLSFYAPTLSYYYHEITNNFVDGKEIIYITDTENPYIPNDIRRVILINCSNFEVSGRVFENTTVGVLAIYSNNFRITNNLFRSLYAAVEMRICENITIDNNEIYNCSGTGLWVLTADNVLIYNNKLHTSTFNNNDGRAAIYFYNVNFAKVSTNNIFESGGSAIRCESTTNVSVSNNQFGNTSIGIYSDSDNYMTISNNFIYNCGHALYVFDSNYGEIYGNWIENNSYNGIYLNRVTYYSIFLNNLFDNNQFGLQAVDTSGFGNQFYMNYWNDHIEDDNDLDGYKDSSYIFTSNSDSQSLAIPYSITTPTILTPSGGEEYYKTITITWESATDALGYNITYNVYVSCDGGQSWQVLGKGLNTTSIEWTILDQINSTDCLITVLAVNDLFVYTEAISDAFVIINFGLTLPTIQFPSEDTTVSGTINIEWDSAVNIWNPSVSVEYAVYYSSDDGVTWNELAVDISDNSFIWDTVSVEDGSYLIKIIASTEEGLSKQVVVSITIKNAITTTEPISSTTETSANTIETTTSVTSTTTPGFSVILLLGWCMIFILRRKEYL